MLQGLTFTMIVKALCMLGNVMFQVSPFPQVQRWSERRCTGESDAAPFVAIAFGGWQWCTYGVFAWLVTGRTGFLILLQSNFLGALLGTYYSHVFHQNCRNPSFRTSFKGYLSVIAALVLTQFCALAVLPRERALFLSG